MDIRNNAFLLSGSIEKILCALWLYCRDLMTKNEETETLLISLTSYRSTLIFRCTLAKRRCYLLNGAAVY